MENKNKSIRTLRADEIEIRVSQVTEKGCQLLLYKDSRCDKRILDETFGITGWKDRYEEIKGNLYCTISIWDDERKQWVDKCDCGVESRSDNDGNEKKGEASDAFKRAGFTVGVGRELYTRLFYFANVPTKSVIGNNGKPKYELVDKYMKFEVKEISTNEQTEKIEKIKIADNKGNIVFSYGYGSSNSVTDKVKTTTKKEITKSQITKIHTLLGTNEALKEAIYKKFNVTSCKELSEVDAKKMIKTLEDGIAKKKASKE